LLKRNEELISMSIVKESIEEEFNRIKNSVAISESQIQVLNSTVAFLEFVFLLFKIILTIVNNYFVTIDSIYI